MNWNEMNSQQRLKAAEQIADFEAGWAKTNADILQEGGPDTQQRIQREALRLVLASRPDGVDLQGEDMQKGVKLVSDALQVATFQERQRLLEARPERHEAQQDQYLDHEIKTRTAGRMRATSPELAQVAKGVEQSTVTPESRELQFPLVATVHTGDERLDSEIAQRRAAQQQKSMSDEQFASNMRQSAVRKAQQELAASQAQDNPVVAGQSAGPLTLPKQKGY